MKQAVTTKKSKKRCHDYLQIKGWQKETAKIQLEESKGKGGKPLTLTRDQVSIIPIVGHSNLPKDILARGMSFDCQLGPQKNSVQMKKYTAKWEIGQNINS